MRASWYTAGTCLSALICLAGYALADSAAPVLHSLPDLPGADTGAPRLGRDGQKLQLSYDGKQRVWDARLDEFFALKPSLTLDYGKLLNDHLAAGAAMHRDGDHTDIWFNGVFAPLQGLRLRVAGGQLRTGAATVAGDGFSGTIQQNSYLLGARRYWQDGLLSNVGATAYMVEASTNDNPAAAGSGSEIAPGRQQGSALNLSLRPLPGSQVEVWRESRAQSFAGVDNQDIQASTSNRIQLSQQLDDCTRLRGGYSSSESQRQLDLQVARGKWFVSMSHVEGNSRNDMTLGVGYRLPLGGNHRDQERCQAAPAAQSGFGSMVDASVKRPDQFPTAPLTTIVSN